MAKAIKITSKYRTRLGSINDPYVVRLYWPFRGAITLTLSPGHWEAWGAYEGTKRVPVIRYARVR